MSALRRVGLLWILAALTPISVVATRATAEASETGAFADVPFQSGEAPSVREDDLDGDGQLEVILENAHVRMIFAPAMGGVCRSLRLKSSGAELVHAQQSGYGLLRDQLWWPRYSFADRYYFHRSEQTRDAASVEMWTTGVGGMMSFTEIRKRITIRRDSETIDVQYRLTNEPSSQTDYDYGFWSHNWLGVPGRLNTYFFPTTQGVRSFTLDPSRAETSSENWYRNPARGWTAVLSDLGTGLAVEVPYRYLNRFYHRHDAGSPAATHEWWLNLIEVEAGEELQADFTFTAFDGLSRVDGVVGGVVGEIDSEVQDNRIEVVARLVTPHGRSEAAAELRLLSPGGSGEVLASAALEPGATVELKARAEGLQPGVHRASVSLVRGATALGSFERAIPVGGVPLVDQLEPEGERVGRAEPEDPRLHYWRERPGHEISTAVVTPHVPWARPYAGGKIRALVLLDDMNSREAVELAQRLDLELDYVKFRTSLEERFQYQGDRSIQTLEAAQRKLAEKLRTRYDVIVVAGFKWDFHFTAELRAALLEQVRRGTGLVLIQPDGFDEAAAREIPAAGVAKKGKAARHMSGWFRNQTTVGPRLGSVMSAWHRWAQAGEHPLATGLDWDRFPTTRRHEFDMPPQGEVIATIGDDEAPLLILGTVGEGRVVCGTWDTLTHDMTYRGFSALTPVLSHRGAWLRPEFAALPRGYHEWWFALLTRLTAWAAGRDTGVSITAAPPVAGQRGNPNEVSLTVRSQRVLSDAYVETHWFSGIGEPYALTKTPAVLGRGETTLALPVPTQTPAHANTACFIVRDAAGASLAWGFTSVDLAAPTWLTQLHLEPDTLLPEGGVWQEDGAVETRAFRPSQPLRAAVRLAMPAPQALEVLFTFTDSHGRILARSRADVVAGATQADAVLEPQVLVHQGIEVTAKLADAERVWDVRRARAVAYRPRVWNRFWFTSWGGQYLWRTKYLFDFNSRLVRDWGLDVSLWGGVQLHTGKVRENAFWGINHSWLNLLIENMPAGVPDFKDYDLATKAEQYAKTGEKRFLVRTPSLADPDWRAAVRERLVEVVGSTMPPGTYDYSLGDEMSLSHYTRFHDFDWSEHSLADFRLWLKERRADLTALNTAWGTAYERWDDVVPLTREEALEAENPAPWFEFRAYMNHQVADFFSFVQQTIRSVDPHARVGLSGTQAPEAANGMEWWKLATAMSYYHSYNTGWSSEMRRSFQRYGGADQSPYHSGYEAVNPLAEYRMWWCLFHDTRGISAWRTNLFFYGDFTQTASGRDTGAHLREFRRGIWRLLRGATRQHDGVAIYYSMPSIIAGALGGEENGINWARDAWGKLIEASGLQYEFVAHEQIADGLLGRGEFKVVILPYTLALSRAEAKALRAFVDAGGSLIATRPVGVRDDLGRPQRPGLLDDLFETGLGGEPRAVEPHVTLVAPVGGLNAGTEVRLPVAATDVVLSGAQAYARGSDGAVPALTTAANGRAHLLNLDLTRLRRAQRGIDPAGDSEARYHSPTARQMRAIVLTLLGQAGVRPTYPLRLASGRGPRVETIRYVLDGVELLCLLNADEKSDVAAIDLGERRHVYDVRAEAFLGEFETLKVPLDPMGARVFCLAPEPLPAPILRAPGAAAREVAGGAGTLEFTVGRAGPAPARQLVRITVADGNGRNREELMQTVWVNGEPGGAFVPLALNDPAGAWTITATDVMSGQRAAAKVVVR